MKIPLMPQATAVWLVENTSLSFQQVGDFCGLHMLEVQGIADEEVAAGIKGKNPIASGELTIENIKSSNWFFLNSKTSLNFLGNKILVWIFKISSAFGNLFKR